MPVLHFNFRAGPGDFSFNEFFLLEPGPAQKILKEINSSAGLRVGDWDGFYPPEALPDVISSFLQNQQKQLIRSKTYN